MDLYLFELLLKASRSNSFDEFESTTPIGVQQVPEPSAGILKEFQRQLDLRQRTEQRYQQEQLEPELSTPEWYNKLASEPRVVIESYYDETETGFGNRGWTMTFQLVVTKLKLDEVVVGDQFFLGHHS